MLFSSKDLVHELQREKEKIARTQRALIDEVHNLIQQGEAADAEIIQRLVQSKRTSSSEIIFFDQRDVFSLDIIKTICTKFRLRFLPSNYFKPEIPYEALLKIKELERNKETKLQEFYVMAPSEVFKLEKKTDPLLFAALGNNKFLLIYRWGKDLSRIREVVSFPLRNLSTFLITAMFCSLLVAVLIPGRWIAVNDFLQKMSYSVRMYIFFMFSLAAVFSAVYLHVCRNKNLSEDEWDSRNF